MNATVQVGRSELEQIIERQILERTWRRIHPLHVEVKGGRVVVTGQTLWYHAKQVAIHAVLEVFRQAGATPVLEEHIRVIAPPSCGHPLAHA
jgi:hypothetical protein